MRPKLATQENLGSCHVIDYAQAMLLLKQKCYHEIQPGQKYKVRPLLLKNELRTICKRVLAQVCLRNVGTSVT